MSAKLSVDDTLRKAKSYAKKGNITEAQKLYHAILSNFPNNDRARQGLANLNVNKKTNSSQKRIHEAINQLVNLFNQGQIVEVVKQAEFLLRQYPQEFIIWNILGGAYATLKDFDQALKALKKVIELNPNYVDAYYNIGVVLNDQGKIDKAIEAYQRCIALFPNYTDSYINMGQGLRAQGKHEKALEAFITAESIKPDHPEAYFNIGATLKGIFFKKPNPRLQKIITCLLDKKTYVRPKDISKAAISLLKLDPKINQYLETKNFDGIFETLEVIKDLSKLPLLLKLMSVCPVDDLDLENLLEKLRAKLLMSIAGLTNSAELLKFQSALALQCFTNEYIYNQSDDEKKAVGILEDLVKQTLKEDKKPSPQIILCLASYKALNQYEWSYLLISTNEIKDVFTRQILEPNNELHLRKKIPLLEDITDKISSKVRDQYERSPYPRWVNLKIGLKPAPISKIISDVKLKIFDKKIKAVKSPEILIAGCGTGQHSIGTATRFKDSKVLAVDLSLSSLSYAKRKTEELSIQNIDYMQADILDLLKLDRKFDIVESAGVIHHMDDPFVAWSILKDCLKSGGLMKIALYSDLARQHIVEMRKEISDKGIGSSDFEMKSFRNMLVKSDKTHHKLILNSPDIFCLSTLKDLLFHVQEHRFNITQIREHLSDLGLQFCGFESDAIISHFKLANTEDTDLYNLDKWQAYEEANPRAFAGMYQFWCQKIS